MYNNRTNYIATNESHNIATVTVVATVAAIGGVFKTLTCFVGGVELFLAGTYGMLAYWLLSVIHNINAGSSTGVIFWILLTIVFVGLWAITLFHLVRKRLMPAFLLLSMSLAVFSYVQVMNTRLFDNDDWFLVGLFCVGVFYLTYWLSLKIVTTNTWRPHKYYSLDGDDDSWNFIDGGGIFKRFLIGVGSIAYLFILLILPILVAFKAYRYFM